MVLKAAAEAGRDTLPRPGRGRKLQEKTPGKGESGQRGRNRGPAEGVKAARGSEGGRNR